jgi:hypothetical protein
LPVYRRRRVCRIILAHSQWRALTAVAGKALYEPQRHAASAK